MVRHTVPSLCCVFLLLCACKAPDEYPVTAIVGAVLIDGTGGPPISNSVVTIEGSRIRAAGARTSLTVPASAEKIDASGKFLVPGLIDLDAPLETSAGRPGIRRRLNGYLNSGVTAVRSPDLNDQTLAIRREEREGSLTAARLLLAGRARTAADVNRFGAQRPDAIEAEAAESALEGILDESRRYRIPVFARGSTLAAARLAVSNGAAGILQIIGDTETIDPVFIARLRDLRLVVAPALAQVEAGRSGAARRNTKRLSDGGVAIGVASGGNTFRELELLAEAGLSPTDVIAAATRNGALALGQLEQLGTIEPGKRADLLLLSANPAEDVHNLRKIDGVMLDGQWVRRER